MATEHRIAQSANRIEIQLDGTIVGLMQNLRASDDYGLDPASGIGDIHVQEYVPSLARHQISCSTMVLFAVNLANANIAMENGDEVLNGLVFDIVVFGKDPNNAGELRKYKDCSFATGDIEITKHQIVAHNATFFALDATGRGI